MSGSGSKRTRPGTKSTALEEVVEQIKTMIRNGDQLPGGRLPAERDLAERMNVSRPTIREALRALSLLGIVENRPGSGTYLIESASAIPPETLDLLFLINKSAIFDVYEARKGLETWVASQAARRRTDEDLAAMKSALEGMEKSISKPADYSEQEARFHMAVVHAAKNMVMTHLMERLYGFLAQPKIEFHALEGDLELNSADYQRHFQLYTFIREGNEQGAAAAMLYDLLVFEKKLKEIHPEMVPDRSGTGPD